ncbi:hypothetical protein PtA15_4A75 [Puccinia triticina]|uniref:Cyclin-like domain-containing protein n=1 Tax=Puccinia triticina TaxID=208348 RepID=A0ABY7CI64_9BASI|nr:uncharacterized protein PtA15_4A75 [Puccinia triticina]WAQ83627.1 hypothetical protein PtA15_4A75 [Puccinia triticina]
MNRMTSTLRNPLASVDEPTPSALDGVPAELERELRLYGGLLIQQAGVLLKLPQIVMATAATLFQRFFFVTSFVHFGIRDVSAGALFLASKLEEKPARIRDIINVYDYLISMVEWTGRQTGGGGGGCSEQEANREAELKVEQNPLLPLEIKQSMLRHLQQKRAQPRALSSGAQAAPPLDMAQFSYLPMDYFAQKFYDRKAEIVVAEMQILKRLGFHVQVQHPYSAMVNYLQVLNLTENRDVSQRAWGALNDGLLTALPGLYPPSHLGTLAVYVAAREHGLCLPGGWWELFDVSGEAELEAMAGVLGGIYPGGEGGTIWVRVKKRRENSAATMEQQLLTTHDTLLLTTNTAPALASLRQLLIGAALGGDQQQAGRDQLATEFILLQGLLHLHPPSQQLFRSEYNLRILLNFLPLALHAHPYAPLGIPLLDLLLITFVDAPANAQLFEAAGGLEILVQAMKQKALKTELRVKVLETLWAWWIDDEEPGPENHPILPPITTHHPSSRSRPNSRIRPISLPPPTLPEEDELANTSGNLSDGHETPKPHKPAPRLTIQPSSTSKPISRSQSSSLQPPPTSTSSPMLNKPTPYSLHKSHPVSLLKNRSDSEDAPQQAVGGRGEGRPSESSEDSDRLDLSPHKLFAPRQRRTALKPFTNNTPQRLIRHKQSASLGSLQLPTSSTALSRQSSEDEGPSGSEPEPRAHREPPSDTPRRPSSKLGLHTPSERKRLSCDTPRAARPAAKTPARQPKHHPRAPSPVRSCSSSSDGRPDQDDEEGKEHTPQRRPQPTPLMLSATTPTPLATTTSKTLITPITPTSSSHNNLIVAGKINPSSACLSPNKRFINKPLSPVHARIYQSDLESIVNATDSDVRPNPALFSHKKPTLGASAAKRRRSVAKHPDHLLTSPPAERSTRKMKKTGILEKYMANSDELVRSFKEIGVGFKALSRHERTRSTADPAAADSSATGESKRGARAPDEKRGMATARTDKAGPAPAKRPAKP